MDKSGSLENILCVLESLVEKTDAILLEVEGLAHEVREALDNNIDAAALADQALEDEAWDQRLTDIDAAATAEKAQKDGGNGPSTNEQPELDIW